MLTLENLVIGYKNRALTAPLSFSFSIGTLVYLTGDNGCGKTTLLRTIAGVIPPFAGRVQIEAQNIADIPLHRRAQLIASMPPRSVLPLWMTVYEAVLLGRHPYRSAMRTWNSRDHDIVMDALIRVEIEQYKDDFVTTLSDGLLQRLFIARAFAQETPILLLDEPTAFLDAKGKSKIADFIIEISKQKLIICATHNLHQIDQNAADREWIRLIQ